MQELRVCVKLRNTPTQTISKNVATGNRIDLAVLHRGILTLQAEINSLLTTVVEKEKQNPSNNVTKKCANGKCLGQSQKGSAAQLNIHAIHNKP